MEASLRQLSSQLEGKIQWDESIRRLYATDASTYRELPLAVAIPKNREDIKKLIHFARQNHTSLIPRTAGTSLAGQVVGPGIVVDVSKHFNRVLEVNETEQWVRVQPGVVRDELNYHLKKYSLFFAPETATANRAMIGGMVGNNSCGANSLIYGSTRDHLLEAKVFLSDGSQVVLKALDKESFQYKCGGQSLESKIYNNILELLSLPENQKEIKERFPKAIIPRRNTGYAIDLLLQASPFNRNGIPFNFCKLLAGSEGTLCFITEVKLNLEPLPPLHTGLVCVHFNSVHESLQGNLIALKYAPRSVELMDHYILERTKENIAQRKNRFFVKGDPQAILVVELAGKDLDDVKKKSSDLETELRENNLGYYYPLVTGDQTKNVWELRNAGLGLLSNMPGDEKPVPVVEDTAVDVRDLPDYIKEFNEGLKRHDLYSVHYAHAGSGELHLRPIINLKTEEGQQLFRTVAGEMADLVKKYKGSLSGEHGDGRLRGEFIPQMIGDHNYKILKEIKNAWDPQNIFNPGKIVDAPPMDTSLRYKPGQPTPEIKTIFNFDRNQGIVRAAEQCNGSGDCRKLALSGGTMCPSYMATRNEQDTTRARANMLREMLTHSTKPNRFDHQEIMEVMDLCLSCKGCKSECPSNIDMAKLKAEFLQHYYDANGVPFRAKMVGAFNSAMALASKFPSLFNSFSSNPFTSMVGKKVLGFTLKRPLPQVDKLSLRSWYQKQWLPSNQQKVTDKGKVLLFCDEFSNYHETSIGKSTVQLLARLGYEVVLPDHLESGRTYLSKGLVRKARDLAIENVKKLSPLVDGNTPIIGIEPSAILTLRDEYIDLVPNELRNKAQTLADNTFLIDEFISQEIDRGHITPDIFTAEQKSIRLHGHCHQKALSSMSHTQKMLSLPKNFRVQLIPSGCCGMAGSFGYEKEHYEVSMQIGELVLFPYIRNTSQDVVIAAPGTSCRHQIKHGTGRTAMHPVEILFKALT